MRFQVLPRPALLLILLATTTPALHAAEAPDETIRRSFPAPDGGKLILKADRGSLEITGEDRTTAEIEVIRRIPRASSDEGRSLLERHQVRFTQDGNTIRVDAAMTGVDRWKWFGPNLEVTIHVKLPRNFNIHARTSGGSIKAAHLAGSADIGTSGGSITVEDVRGTRLEVKTSGGSIHLSGIDAPTVAHTSGGSIEVASASAPIEATTSGGSITAKFTSAPRGDITLKSSAGSIGVTLPAKTGFELDASTSAGTVRSDIPITSSAGRSDHHHSLKGPANGGGPMLKLHTSAGSIRIKAQ